MFLIKKGKLLNNLIQLKGIFDKANYSLKKEKEKGYQ